MAKNDQKKAAALEALLTSSTLTEAAEKAGIDRRTLYGYLHSDIDFARAYDEARNRQAVVMMDTLNANRARAGEVLMEILEDKQQPAAIRIKVAQIIMSEAADRERIIDKIARVNITANKSLFDMSER